MDRKTIQREAARLRQEVMYYVQKCHPNATDAKVFLDPKYAFDYLGFDYEERHDLDLELRLVGEVAGIRRSRITGRFDRLNKVVAVSQSVQVEERRFAAAHELGHIVLHKNIVEHRDRPLGRTQAGSRPVHEMEADVFAAAYLMPKKWVEGDLRERFGDVPVEVNENLAWWLDRTDHDHLLRLEQEADFERAKAVVICTNIGSGHFRSMKDEYRVTITAMALRLMELNLIQRNWHNAEGL